MVSHQMQIQVISISLTCADDEDSTVRNKRELRVSIDNALPATATINSPHFGYLFDEDNEDDEGDEGHFAGIKEDFGIFISISSSSDHLAD